MKKKTQNPEPKPEPKYLHISIDDGRLTIEHNMPVVDMVGYLELIKDNIIRKFYEQATK